MWENLSPSWDGDYTTTPETYGLSAELTRDMALWQEGWETHFHHDRGWDSDESRERWRRDGRSVVARLRREVASFADVRYEPWPLG